MAIPEDLFRQIVALSPPEQLRMAASFLEHQHPEVALAIIERVGDELSVVLHARKSSEVNDG